MIVRPTAVLAATVSLVATLCLLQYSRMDGMHIAVATVVEAPAPLSPLCTAEQWGAGTWQQRSTQSLDALYAIDDYEQFLASQNYTCKPQRYVCRDDGLLRSLKMASYYWSIPSKCRVLDLDADAVMRTLLETGGILFIGDSLIVQQADSLDCMLARHLLRLPADNVSPIPGANIVHYGLSPRSTFAAAHPDQMETVLLGVWFSAHLLDAEAFDTVLHSVTDGPPLSNQSSVALNNKAHLQHAIEFLQRPEVTLSSLVIRCESTPLQFFASSDNALGSVGAHWNNNKLSTNLSPESMLFLYQAATTQIRRLLDKLKLDRTRRIDVFYRSTALMHSNCQMATGPTSADPPVPTQYEWDKIALLDMFWRVCIRLPLHLPLSDCYR